MAEHTPGPWYASAPDGSYHDVIRIYSNSDITVPVAVCPQRQSAIMSVIAGQTDATTEAAANARLIAAAPDLLQACRYALDAAMTTGDDATAAPLQEAIAKAKGTT